MIFGIFTAALLVIFLGVAVWAYSSRRRDDFDDASRLPLRDDYPLETQS